jgi:hypothetical protein
MLYLLLLGVRRLPAICSTGRSLAELGCEMYEVVLCDPLHDFKNLIFHILEELANHIDNVNLQHDVKEFCKKAIGKYIQVEFTKLCLVLYLK